MASYLTLLKFTPQGLQNIHESTHRAAAFQAAAKKAGVKVTQTLWTLGAYDGVIVFEASDDAAVASVMVGLAALGNVQVTTLRAFNAPEFEVIVAKSPRL